MVLIVLIAVLYGNILGNRFTNWDDEHLIVKNKLVRTFDPIHIGRNFHLTYPPLTVLSHSFDFFFWRLNPVGFHITDVCLYLLISVTFYLICTAILNDSRRALLAAVLFAAHPLHVESVSWLSSRKDSLSVFFYFLAFLSFIKAEDGKGGAQLTFSTICYFLALLSKPLTATLPVVLFLYDRLLSPSKRPISSTIKRLLPYGIPIIVIGLATFFIDPHNELTLAYHGGSAYKTFLTVLIILLDYLRMLILPIALSALYIVWIPDTLLNPRLLFTVFLFLTLFCLGVTQRRRRPMLLYCLLWGAISLLPVMQFIPSNVVKADRYLYMPSAAFCLFVAWLMPHGVIASRKKPAFIFIVACFSLLTVYTNTFWKDSVALWKSVTARCPYNADAYNNLGIAYSRAGRYKEAEKTLRHAIALRPEFPSAYNNLANVYRLTGRHEDALLILQKAGGLAKDIVYAANLYISMGLIYEETGQYGKSLSCYEQALRLKPAYLDDSFIIEHIAKCRNKLEENKKDNRY
jgi:hypothetical protein